MSDRSNARSSGEGEAGTSGSPFQDDGVQDLVTASADGIVAVDHRGVIRSCNPAAEVMFGRPAGDLVGTPFGFPVVAQETSEIELLAPGRPPRVVEMRVTSTTWQGERIHVAALRDVTRHKEVEHDLESALERQTTIVAVAAHELRTPVAEIKLLVHLLRDHLSANSDQHGVEVVNQVINRMEGLQALMRKLLTASRIDAEESRSFPKPVAVLALILERLADCGDKAQDVKVSCSPDLAAFVDRQDFSEMLIIYLENAFIHGSPPIEVRATERSGRVEIRVRDSGSGVPAQFVPHLFERFSREPNAGRDVEGTGLGLWIVRSLTEANDGSAWYEHDDGGGACFCLHLRKPEHPDSTG
ncbi:PAS domain-containing protein [Saccharopolyspora karakumensis]|uniref:Sensor-like histidine kinase SenX3 n=1 Tax=Saccharopolyspora karakumensis TaxID=2530386 RepID=A0A4R5BNJ2_9PSEU|nr:PAS domain-containing sensor histidine kinase [Saccharopolyspora karakumensis]TDD86933.1 PAS domain-containing protein [Saccharopolyspora karakumensis]